MSVDTITGTDGNDQLFGTTAAEVILAGAGDDLVETGGGCDSVYGEAGNDTLLSYFGGVILDGGDDDDMLSTLGRHTVLSSVLRGGAGNDTITATGRGDRSFGGDGDDSVIVTVFQFGAARGGTGQDHLDLRFVTEDLQPSDDDFLVLLNGPDAGAQIGTTGYYCISGFESLTITLGAGDDTVRGGGLADSLALGRGMNSAQALGGDDLVSYYTGAANTLNGGLGIDTLQVIQSDLSQALIFTVDHTMATDQHGSVIQGFEAYDISGSDQADEVMLGARHDVAELGLGDDRAFGRGGDDWLFGGAGVDRLFGGLGDDLLVGGSGQDTLIGGAGADQFLFLEPGHGGDLIRDFDAAEDKIVLSQAVIDDALPSGPVASQYFSLDAAIGTTAQFIYRYADTPGQTELVWDANGADLEGEVLITRFLGVPLLEGSSILIL